VAQFDIAVDTVLRNEGGGRLTQDPRDPGGTTRYGISQRAHPNVDIINLTETAARTIYYRDYWERFGIWRLFDQQLAGKVFDMAVVMGGRPAVRCLQRALRAVGVYVTEDGRLGPQTASAANAHDHYELMPALRSECAGRFREIIAHRPLSGVYARGWLRRAYS
jgi:lysozyme family protein